MSLPVVTVPVMHPSQLEQIRRSLAMSSTVGSRVAEELLTEVERLRARVKALGGDPDDG